MDYQLVMPIRLLVAKDRDASLQTRLALLQDHSQERRAEEQNWAQTDRQVVRPIRERLKRSDWTSGDIQRCVGLIRTNATQTLAKNPWPAREDGMEEEEEDRATVRVLYPSMSLMSHSCMPNTRTIHRSSYILEARVMRPVGKGEEFAISYTGTRGVGG